MCVRVCVCVCECVFTVTIQLGVGAYALHTLAVMDAACITGSNFFHILRILQFYQVITVTVFPRMNAALEYTPHGR